MLATQLPNYPWQRLGTDLFQLNGENYIIVIDYYSRYPEVVKLKGTTSRNIIDILKPIFSIHGIPETGVSDNGPQFSSQEFRDFAKQYEFCHVMSSPLYPQSNGQAERGVQTVKNLLRDSSDAYMALLNYRTTPFAWCNCSPAELLMGRQLRSNLPQLNNQLILNWPYLNEFRQHNVFKTRQKTDFDRRHRVRTLSPIPDDTNVWVTSGDRPIPGTVTTSASNPRSYIIQTPNQSNLQRNHRHINLRPNQSGHDESSHPVSPPRRIMTRSQTDTIIRGTIIRPPERF